MRSILLSDELYNAQRVYAPETRALLKDIAGLDDAIYCKADILADPAAFANTDFIFSTWGMPIFTEEEIKACFPQLQCVFFGAGSVQHFARPFINLGIKVFSAWAANGVPVAEYTVAHIILSNKGFYATSRLMSAGDLDETYRIRDLYPGNYGDSVGIIGAGMIGKLVIRMLKQYHLNVKVFDPFLSDALAEELGIKKCSLQELFSTCQVVSNHLANNDQTQGMLGSDLFQSMLPYATFINTGRGAQVVEDDLVAALQARPDLTAVLDVTWPEPPVEGHPFYSLPNCVLTPHIAGSNGDEVHRMSEYMVEEFRLYAAGQPCKYEVSLKMLETMA